MCLFSGTLTVVGQCWQFFLISQQCTFIHLTYSLCHLYDKHNNTRQQRWFEHLRGQFSFYSWFHSAPVSEDGRCFSDRCSSISSAWVVPLWLSSSRTWHWQWVHATLSSALMKKGGAHQNKRWGFSRHTPVPLHGYALNWWQVL